jgi:peptide chain release factor 2
VNSGGFFDTAILEKRLAILDEQMSGSNFWDTPEQSQKVIKEANQIKEKLGIIKDIRRSVEDVAVLYEMAVEENTEQALLDAEKEYEQSLKLVEERETKLILSGPHDAANAIFTIHAGAGGTEACDWANMILRMYQRWAEQHDLKVTVMDMLQGDEAGIKKAELYIEGDYAYGYLKAERGVHRLVRISPFNAAGKRQTSFASVDVVAEVDDDIDIKIEDKDIRVDVYRSGGPGGQGVNTTDSAVRITHMPSGLIVTCQNERSQIKNRAQAMKVLKSRLYEIEMEKKQAELDKANSSKGEIGFGHQIRSYVFQPYQMVKDLRTGESSTNIQGVMDGDLDAFILAFLKGKKRSDADVDDDV